MIYIVNFTVTNEHVTDANIFRGVEAENAEDLEKVIKQIIKVAHEKYNEEWDLFAFWNPKRFSFKEMHNFVITFHTK